MEVIGRPRRINNIGEVSQEEAEIYTRNSELNINRQEIPIGTVVYYIKKHGHEWRVDFGTVEEHYTSEICIQLYDFADTRLINGVPSNEFVTPTKWKKLPKGWSYNTKLFECSDIELPAIAKTLSLSKTDDILTAIKEGILVKVQNIDYCHFCTEIDSKKGWRIIRQYPMTEHHPEYKSFIPCELFRTYEEAQKMIDIHQAELKRQANLSDLEWSIEQIDKVIDRWAITYDISTEEKAKCRERIMCIDKLENVETRVSGGMVQWKYEDKERWMTVEY